MNEKVVGKREVIVVLVDIAPNAVFTPAAKTEGEVGKREVGNQSLQAKDNIPENFVIEHIPGSDFKGFTSKATPLAVEPVVTFDLPKSAPGFKIEFAGTLSIPKNVKVDAIEKIQIGMIQLGQLRAKGLYGEKKEVRKAFLAGREVAIDPAFVVKGFQVLDWNTTTGVWPWYGAQFQGSKPWTWNAKVDPEPRKDGDDLVVVHPFIFQDSPNAVIPLFLDGVKANGQNPVVVADLAKFFNLYFSARTLDSENKADQLFFAQSTTQWSVRFDLDPTRFKNDTKTNANITPLGKWVLEPKEPFEVPVNILPTTLISKAPFLTWVPVAK